MVELGGGTIVVGKFGVDFCQCAHTQARDDGRLESSGGISIAMRVDCGG